jgi:hypothetical protein
VEIEAGEAFTDRIGNCLVRAFIHAIRQAVQTLRGRTRAPGEFSLASLWVRLLKGMALAGQVPSAEAQARTDLLAEFDHYLAWDAAGKVGQLEREFPFLTARSVHPIRRSGTRDPGLMVEQANTDLSVQTVDLLAVLRTSQALSSETSLDRLQERVTELLCGLTGATSVRLLLRDREKAGWYLLQQGGARAPRDHPGHVRTAGAALGAALGGAYPSAPAGRGSLPR